MVFREKTYSVLLVSANEKFSGSITALLSPGDFYPVTTVTDAGHARRLLLENSYDLVLINTPLPDEFGTALASDICRDTDSGVLIFVKAEMYDDIYAKVVESGVMVISKPVSSQMVSQTIRVMCSAQERMRGFEAKQVSVEDKIKEIRLINKAKWVLIECLSMTEQEAHRYIEKQAMDRRLPKAEIAENIIKTYS